jgi:hypothetical protein
VRAAAARLAAAARPRWVARWPLVPAFLCLGALLLEGLPAWPDALDSGGLPAAAGAWLYLLQWDQGQSFIAAALACLLLALAWPPAAVRRAAPAAARPPWGRMPSLAGLWRDLRGLLWLAWLAAEAESALLVLAAWALFRAVRWVQRTQRRRLVAGPPRAWRADRARHALRAGLRQIAARLVDLLFWWPLRVATQVLAWVDCGTAWAGWALRCAARPVAAAALVWLAGALLAAAFNFWRLDVQAASTAPSTQDAAGALLGSPSLVKLLRQRGHGDAVQALAARRLARALRHHEAEAAAAALRAGAVGGRFVVPHRGLRDKLGNIGIKPDTLNQRLNAALAATGVQLAVDDAEIDLDSVLRSAQNELAGSAAVPTQLFIDAARRRGLRMDPVAAASVGHPAVLRWALEAPGAIAVRDWQGRTPAMAALEALAGLQDRRRERVAAVQASVDLLLGQAQDLALRDHAGRSLAYFALLARQPKALNERLIAAVGADARTAAGATLAHAAALSAAGPEDIRSMGLDSLALPWAAPSDDGQTPLHWARSPALLRWLIAERGLDPDTTDHRGRTALHAAIVRDDDEVAFELARFTSRLQAVDALGRTAADDVPGEPAPEADGRKPKDRWWAVRSTLAEAAQPRSRP